MKKIKAKNLKIKQVGLLAVFLILLIALSASAQDFRIFHDPAPSVKEGRPIKISAELEGITPDDVEDAHLWFRPQGLDSYSSIPFTQSFGQFSGIIPGDISASAVAIEYYLEFRLIDGKYATYPYFDPEQNPFTISVQKKVEKEEIIIGEDILILAPDLNGIERESKVMIAVAYSPDGTGRYPEMLQLLVDGRDQTKKAKISNKTLIAIVGGLESGTHRVELIAKSGGESKTVAGWNFEVRLPVSSELPTFGDFTGTAGVEGTFERRNGNERDISAVFGSIGGRFVEWQYQIEGRFTSQESGRLQPQNRYQIAMSSNKGYIKVGDVYPAYNEFILWGRRIRGFDLMHKWDKWSFQTAYGNLNRSVEGRISSIDSTFNTTDPANPVLADIDTTYGRGTYKRWMWSARLGYDDHGPLEAGFTVLKAKDERHSITYGANPQDNLVTGIDLKYSLDQRRTILELLTSFSMHNQDISEPTYQGYGWLRDIIWINVDSSPVPSDTSGGFSSALSMLSKSMTMRARARMRYYDHNIQAGWRLINHSYRSLANPTLINDRHGIFINDRFPIAKGKVYLNGGADLYWDNVRGQGDITNTFHEFYAGLSFYSSNNLPNITVTFRNRGNKNDASREEIIQGEGITADTTIIDTRREQNTNLITFSASQRLSMLGGEHDINFNTVTLNKADTYNEQGDAAQLNFALSVRSSFDNPLSSLVSVSQATSEAAGGLNDLGYSSVSWRLGYSMLDSKLKPYFAPRYTLGTGTNIINVNSPTEQMQLSGLDLTDPIVAAQIDSLNLTTPKSLHVDFARIDWIAGFDYEFIKNHVLRAYVSKTSYTDNGEIEYFNGSRFSISEETVTNTDGVNSVTFEQAASKIKRDDFVAMMTYTYRF